MSSPARARRPGSTWRCVARWEPTRPPMRCGTTGCCASAIRVLIMVALALMLGALWWNARRGRPVGLVDDRLLALVALGAALQIVLAKWVTGHYYQLPLALALVWDAVRAAPRWPWIGLAAAAAFAPWRWPSTCRMRRGSRTPRSSCCSRVWSRWPCVARWARPPESDAAVELQGQRAGVIPAPGTGEGGSSSCLSYSSSASPRSRHSRAVRKRSRPE